MLFFQISQFWQQQVKKKSNSYINKIEFPISISLGGAIWGNNAPQSAQSIIQIALTMRSREAAVTPRLCTPNLEVYLGKKNLSKELAYAQNNLQLRSLEVAAQPTSDLLGEKKYQGGKQLFFFSKILCF